MGILKTFKEIIDLNINALLDKAQNDVMKLENIRRQIEPQREQVKNEIAGVMAEESRRKRIVDENEKEIANLTAFARKAIEAQNDADAILLLEKKKSLEELGGIYNQAYTIAHDNSLKMGELLEKLERDISQLNGKIAHVKAMKGLTDTQNTINKLTSTIGGTGHSSSTVDSIMEKAQFEMDRAAKRAEMDVKPMDETTAVIDKYKRLGVNSAVFDELNKLKAEVHGSAAP